MVRLVKPKRPPPPPPHTCEKCERYYLSEQDRKDRHAQIDEEFGDGTGCGGWTWEPPCGGCIDCYHMMVSHYFQKEREEAYRAHAAGFEYANQSVIDTMKIATATGKHTWGEKHDWQGHLMAGEIER